MPAATPVLFHVVVRAGIEFALSKSTLIEELIAMPSLENARQPVATPRRVSQEILDILSKRAGAAFDKPVSFQGLLTDRTVSFPSQRAFQPEYIYAGAGPLAVSGTDFVKLPLELAFSSALDLRPTHGHSRDFGIFHLDNRTDCETNLVGPRFTMFLLDDSVATRTLHRVFSEAKAMGAKQVHLTWTAYLTHYSDLRAEELWGSEVGSQSMAIETLCIEYSA